MPLCVIREEVYEAGRNVLQIDVPRIELTVLNLKKSHILTTGLLTCKPLNSGNAGLSGTSTSHSHDDAGAGGGWSICEDHSQPARTGRLT